MKKNEIVSKDKLAEAGAYFGHKTFLWNPKMKPFIAFEKKRIHVIDISKTQAALEFAYNFIKKLADADASFIFVGTKKQAKKTIKENALRSNSHYVSERWLGGTLTNNFIISKRIRRLEQLEKMQESNFENFTKKEGVLFSKELAKLLRNLEGIRNMRSKPKVMIVADPIGDLIAIKEARKLGIRIIGIIDSNVDPTLVDIPIPANDDSLKSISLIITILADAIVESKGGAPLYAFKPDDEINLPTDSSTKQVKTIKMETNNFNKPTPKPKLVPKKVEVKKPTPKPKSVPKKVEVKKPTPKPKQITKKVEVKKPTNTKKEDLKKMSTKKLLLAINTIENDLKKVVDLKKLAEKYKIEIPTNNKKVDIIKLLVKKTKHEKAKLEEMTVVELKQIAKKNSISIPFRWKKSYIVGIIKKELKIKKVEYLGRQTVEQLKKIAVKEKLVVKPSMKKDDIIKLITKNEVLSEMTKKK